MRLARNLRISVSIGWVVAWNLLFAIAFLVNGGFRTTAKVARCKLLVATALFGTALFSLAIALVPVVSYWALRKGAHVAAIRNDLFSISILSTALGCGMTFSFGGSAGV